MEREQIAKAHFDNDPNRDGKFQTRTLPFSQIACLQVCRRVSIVAKTVSKAPMKEIRSAGGKGGGGGEREDRKKEARATRRECRKECGR